MATPQKVSGVLNTPNDWDEWIQVVKTQAIAGDIWDHVDPKRDQIPTLGKPELPKPQNVNREKTTYAELTTEEKEEFRMMRQDYKQQFDLYERQRAALASLRAYIQSSVSRNCLYYTFECETAREMLIELQKRFKPTDQLRELYLAVKYQKLKKPPKSQDLDTWLQSWERVYHECDKAKLPDVQLGRANRYFLRAISTLAPEFATYWRNEIAKEKRRGQTALSLDSLVEEFRDHRWHLGMENDQPRDSAFFQGQEETPKRKCLCGEQHTFRACPYLIQERQPAGWKPDPAIQEQINAKMKYPKVRYLVNKARASQKEQPQQSKENKEEKETEKDIYEEGTFAVSISTFLTSSPSEEIYALHDSFLLYSASTIHICNNPDRFQSLQPAKDDYLLAGASKVPIKGYGIVEIILQRPSGTIRTIRLANVALVPSFHTNIVSLDRLMQKDIHWDTKQQQLKRGDEIFCKIEKRHGQWVLEYAPISPATFSARSAQPRSDAEATADQWHQRLGHAGPDALEHLSAVIGAKLKGPSIIECEDCSLSKAHKQISRRTTPRPSTPFEKVHFDLIQMSEGFNGDEWILLP
jgi:hypothetical protein